MNKSPRLSRWLNVAAPLPALAVGVLVMQRAGLPPAIWGQNLAAGLVLATVCVFLPAMDGPPSRSPWWNVIALGVLGLLQVTFLGPGLESVQRWVLVGPLRVHAGAICLPALLLVLGAKLRMPGGKNRVWLAVLIGLGASMLLALQPDAAQATAFAGALLVLLLSRRDWSSVSVASMLAAVLLAAWAWKRPDPLAPVRQVEGIVGMAAQNGAPWQFGALLALALLPMPFLFAGRRGDCPTALALGVYFLLCLLAPLVGVFPVPVMGFGLSPIIGYYIAIGWLAVRERLAGC